VNSSVALQPKSVRLRVRPNHKFPWIANFSVGGWIYITPEGERIRLTAENTKIRNPYYDENDPDSQLWLAVEKE